MFNVYCSVRTQLRTRSPRKSGAKVGIKKTSLEYRDSFGIDGTILGFWGLKWDSNGYEMGSTS